MPLSQIWHSDPEIMGGVPVFTGTRVPVRSLFDYLEGGESLDEFLRQFPSVKREQAVAALDAMRLRAFPFSDAVLDFINAHDQIFLVEQNRDAQMRSLLVNELGIDPARFISILHYDGTPITARFIIAAIAERIALKSKEAAE